MLGIRIDRRSGLPIKRQIYCEIKDRIVEGLLKGGDALPSTRALARDLVVSRNTVCEAYDMLIAEGFLKNRQGAPCRVAQGLGIGLPVKGEPRSEPPKRVWKADFRTGQPDLKSFPRFSFEQALREGAANMPASALGYTSPQGSVELREQIAAWLYRSRGIIAEAGDIFITAGATHALHLAAGLLEAVKHIQIEDPCHSVLMQIFSHRGYNVLPVPVDEHGLQTEYLRDIAASVYVTPSHQFPLGGILSAERRAALIRCAREYDAYIIEDDYDSEFRYSGDPVAPLYTMDPSRVIYVGTLSKTLFPALRIGYVILPRVFHKRWRELRMHMDLQNPPYEQAALAQFFRTRKLDRHVQRMRRLYGQRRQILLDSLTDAFGDAWRPCGDAAGLHLAAGFPGRVFDGDFTQRALRQGIRLATVGQHCIQNERHQDKLLLGYGHLGSGEIANGVALLKDFMESE